MTIKNKTPSARKATWSYCRRCLAVMLCCVLVSGLVAPRGKAATPPAIAWGNWASAPVESTFGFNSLVAAGGLVLKMGEDMQTRLDCMYRGYDLGYALDGAIRAGELSDSALAWWTETVDGFKTQGGIAPGDSFTVPSTVAEEIRAWVLGKLEFMDGSVSYDDYILEGDLGNFVLSDVDTTELDAYTSKTEKSFVLPVRHVGSLISWPTFDYSADYTSSVEIGNGVIVSFIYDLKSEWSCSVRSTVNFIVGEFGGTSTLDSSSFSGYRSLDLMADKVEENIRSDRQILFYSPTTNRLYAGEYYASGNYAVGKSTRYLDMADLQPAVTTTITQTPASSTPVTKDMAITVPADVPVTKVGDYSVPVIGDVAAKDLLNPGAVADDPAFPTTQPGITAQEVTDAVSKALPITGAIAGDQVVEEINRDPDSLGAVFITKFPFSIPWDVVKAIKLLAAPPVVPHWEIDLYAPMKGKWGFNPQGDTTIVIDFERFEFMAQIIRWTSTLMFVYCLALGTKRLIWTA